MSQVETVAEFDIQLEKANRRMEQEGEKLREENKQLEILLLEKKIMLEKMEAIWRLTKSRKTVIDREIAEIIKAA